MEAKMPVLLLSLGLLSTGTCYLRGDYNPGLYIFAYLLWNFKVIGDLRSPTCARRWFTLWCTRGWWIWPGP